MMKNYLKHTGLLMLLVVGMLLAMHFLPRIELGSRVMRRVDLLSDVRPRVVEEAVDDTAFLMPPKPKPVFVDSCPQGKVCIEDYGDSTHRGMEPFYQALDEAGKRVVRIAYFGDSFIEADILTADLREMLQQKYGGSGVGFVPVTSNVNGFRPTVKHSFSGWESHAAVDTIGFDASRQGLSGHYFLPRSSGAYVELRGQDKYASRLDTCRRASVFFKSLSSGLLNVRQNGAVGQQLAMEPAGNIQALSVDGRIGSVRWTVEQADSAVFYGVSMDDVMGIGLDNFSLRGASGLSLRRIPLETLRDFDRCRHYDLIVLQYGLNVATERGRNYDHYAAGLREAIEHLKKAFPEAGLLIVGVGDRDYRTEEGELRTMPGIKNLVRYQQNLAADCGIAFWNLFEAMGGDLSMAKLVEAKPAKANLDYTHINFRGGKYLAGLLYEALVWGKEQYDKKRAYEME